MRAILLKAGGGSRRANTSTSLECLVAPIWKCKHSLVIAAELGFGDDEKRLQAEALSHEVGKMLVALMNKL